MSFDTDSFVMSGWLPNTYFSKPVLIPDTITSCVVAIHNISTGGAIIIPEYSIDGVDWYIADDAGHVVANEAERVTLKLQDIYIQKFAYVRFTGHKADEDPNSVTLNLIYL